MNVKTLTFTFRTISILNSSNSSPFCNKRGWLSNLDSELYFRRSQNELPGLSHTASCDLVQVTGGMKDLGRLRRKSVPLTPGFKDR